MSDIILTNISISFAEKRVLNNFSHTFKEGSYTSLMGASGSGKTTLLRVMLGLETPQSGTVTGVPEKVSVVFQEDRLSESYSLFSNMKMVTGKTVSADTIREHLEELGLGAELKTPVRVLSGGMKRRAAIARAVLFGGDVFFIDEAFKGLDEDTKADTMEYFKRHTAGKTVIAVTHDPDEAEFFGGEVLEL